MKLRELIKRVQLESGFSDTESKEALEMMVESLAVRLDEGERKDFASQLPPELQDLALSVFPSRENTSKDIIQQFMEMEHIEEDHAKKQVLSAWKVLKQAINDGEVRHIKSQLSKKTATLLH
jgi:uncharacterized protein (DUF2267 family)